MDAYRLYILDALTGRIEQERCVVAKDDETAIWISEGLRHTRPMELWQRGSKIHGWDAIKRTLVELDSADISSVPAARIVVH